MLIRHLELLTNDLAATERFYGSVMGFPVGRRSEQSITFLTGISKLTFHFSDSSRPFYHFAFLIPKNQLEEALAWATNKLEIIPFNAQTVVATFENWHAKAFYFYDNHQNILEFICRYDLVNDSQKPFNCSGVISVNEIGIVTENVLQEREKLVLTYGLNFFKKGPALPDFTAIGDDHGLLLVTEIGRGWWPTQTPAQKHWTKVSIEHNKKIFQLEIP